MYFIQITARLHHKQEFACSAYSSLGKRESKTICNEFFSELF